MKTLQRTTLMLALAGALSMPSVLLAAEATEDEHTSHHPEEAQEAATQAPTPAGMQERRRIRDPRMKGGEDCLMAGQKGGGMRGPGMGMMGGKGGMSMMSPGMMRGGMTMGQGMSGQDGMLSKRMEMLEKRMDLMQMMLQMQMQMSGPQASP